MINFSLHEAFVLQAILLKPDLIAKAVSKLTDHDFQGEAHRVIYQAMVTLYNGKKPIDLITIQDALPTEKPYTNRLIELAAEAQTSANFGYHLSQLLEYRQQAQLMAIAAYITNAIKTGDDTKDIVSQVSQRVVDIMRAQHEQDAPEQGAVVIKRVVDMLSNPVKRDQWVMTGIPSLDRNTGGLRPGEVMVIGGSPGHGKSALAIQIAAHAACRGGKSILIFSLEMTNEQVIMRSIANIGQVSFTKLRQGKLDTWDGVIYAADKLSASRIWLHDKSGLTIDQLVATAKALAMQQQIDCIVVDYLQLMGAVGKRAERSREQEVSSVSRGLKHLAKDLHIPIISLSQLGRGIDRRPSKRPILADLRESGAIEHDADLVAFICQPCLYGAQKPEEYAELIVAKHRHGPVGTIELHWDRVKQTFMEIGR